MEQEIWKPVEGYEGLYEVSNLGRVRSLPHTRTYYYNGQPRQATYRGRIRKQDVGAWGYCRVVLCDRGEQKHCLVHRLVAEAFVPNPDHLPDVNHRDENKQNNRWDNLEWCTQSYNNQYGTRIERIDAGGSLCAKKPVGKYDPHGNLIERYASVVEAAERHGIHRGTMTDRLKGRSKNDDGHGNTFRYIDE